MTCANWAITILALISLVLVFYPSLLGESVSMWVMAIAAILIIIVVWTGCKCKWCEMADKKKKR